eukprot:14449474-Heterocapsa_arctica.AAC.1
MQMWGWRVLRPPLSRSGACETWRAADKTQNSLTFCSVQVRQRRARAALSCAYCTKTSNIPSNGGATTRLSPLP